MMQVEVPITFTTSPSFTPAPMASQCASNAPTGIGIPGAQPKFAGPLLRQVPGDLIGGGVAPVQLFADAREQRIDCHQKVFRRQAAERFVPHPLVAHGANAAPALGDGSVMPQRTAATISQCSKAEAKLVALLGIVPQPVQQL